MGRPSYSEETELLFSQTTSVIGALCAIIFSIVGTVGNIFTIVALWNSKLRSHPTTLFIISLALSDLIFSSFNLPLQAHRFLHRGCVFMCLNDDLCQYYPFFLFGNIGVSVQIMMLIALQRVFGVFYGHSLEIYFNRVTVSLMILLSWICSFGSLCLPLTKTWGQFGFEYQTFSCTLVESDGETFFPVLAGVGVGVPTFVIAASYGAIYYKVKETGKMTRKAARNRASLLEVNGPHSIAAQTKERERSLTITFSLLYVTFLVCFLPWGVLTVVDPIPPSRLGWLHMITFVLSWSSALVNPLIYCFTNKYYMEAFKQLIRNVIRRSASSASRRTEMTSARELLELSESRQQSVQ